MASGRMTKMHFDAIASVLAGLRPDTGNRYASKTRKAQGAAAFEQWRETVRQFADLCAASNVLFDRERFYAACNYPYEVAP